MDEQTMKALEKWAADEFRSLNGQIEYILTEALKKSGRTVKKKDGGQIVGTKWKTSQILKHTKGYHSSTIHGDYYRPWFIYSYSPGIIPGFISIKIFAIAVLQQEFCYLGGPFIYFKS